MKTEDTWRVLLNEYNKKNTRLIFAGSKHRSLIDITIQTQQVDNIINTVLSSEWNDEQVIRFLNSESEKYSKLSKLDELE